MSVTLCVRQRLLRRALSASAGAHDDTLAPSSSSAAHKPLPVTPAQRVLVSLGAAIVGFIDPSRADMIALLGELTGEPALRRMRDTMLGTEEGRAVLEERPRIKHATVAAARSTFPSGSLGAAYAAYLDLHGFNPDDRGCVRFVSDPTLAYVMTRYREVHDTWHVLTGLPPTVLGEAALKALEAAQTGLPMAGLSALVTPARLSHHDASTFWRVYVPWATETSKTCVPLMSVAYEARWAQPLEQVRAELGVRPAPTPPRE